MDLLSYLASLIDLYSPIISGPLSYPFSWPTLLASLPDVYTLLASLPQTYSDISSNRLSPKPTLVAFLSNLLSYILFPDMLTIDLEGTRK